MNEPIPTKKQVQLETAKALLRKAYAAKLVVEIDINYAKKILPTLGKTETDKKLKLELEADLVAAEKELKRKSAEVEVYEEMFDRCVSTQ